MSIVLNGSSGVTTPGISNSEGYTGDGLTIAAGAPSGAVAVDSSGNLGLGVTPSGWGVAKPLQVLNAGFYGYDTHVSGVSANGYYDGSAWKYISSSGSAATRYEQSAGRHTWYTAPSGTAGNAISFTQAMTLDASGNLLVGLTDTSVINAKVAATRNGNGIAFGGRATTTSDIVYYGGYTGTTGTCYLGYWVYNGSYVGAITSTGSTTNYASASDYRLKENIQPMTGALAKVAALKPVTYKWKVDGSDGEGFIAHELAEVVPQCVTGEKDAVDAEGKPVYQGIDTSFLVATLTAAIQELKAQVDAQAVEIAALKGQA